jgi:ribosome-binding protein aMBF1 (putative translation factor)
MKHKVCKCCGKKITSLPVVQPSAHHLCHDCASAEELTKAPHQDEKHKEKGAKIILLDRYR